MQPTSEKLAQALRTAGLFEMEKKARAGRYDDFRSDSATPIVDLVHDLQRAGCQMLAARVMNGEFDSTKEEAEEWFAKEGKGLIKDLVRKGDRGD